MQRKETLLLALFGLAAFAACYSAVSLKSIFSTLGSGMANIKEVVSTNSLSETSSDVFNKKQFVAHHQQHQRQADASATLEQMKHRGAMEYSFSTRDYASAHGFPLEWQWGPCVLEEAFQRKCHQNNEPLELVLVGGSACTRPATNCSFVFPNTNLSLSGRFSDYLDLGLAQQQQYNRSSLNFRLTRRANGAHDSATDALLLDGAIDLETTDVILWEFVINDWKQGAGLQYELMEARLDFWLTRLHAHYSQAQAHNNKNNVQVRPPPAILLTLLWKNGQGNQHSYKTVSAQALENGIGALIEKYNALGWKIAAIDVGAAVQVTTELLQTPTKVLFDDNHHPNCQGVRFIADLIQHALYSNVAASNSHCAAATATLPSTPRPAVVSNIPLPRNHTFVGVPSHYQKLWTDLYNENYRIGSVTAWEPRNPNATNLRVAPGTIDYLQNQPKSIYGKAAPGRADRKNAFLIPQCQSNSNSTTVGGGLNLTLLEPGLKWLGLSLPAALKQNVSLHINDVRIEPSSNIPWKEGIVYLNEWVNVRESVPNADMYVVSLCHQDTVGGGDELYGDRRYHNQHWVGVVLEG